MIKVIGLGAGGHAKVLLEILKVTQTYEVIGLLDIDSELWNRSILGVPILGDDHLLSELYTQGIRHAFIGLGTVGDSQPRTKLYEKVSQQGFKIIDTIHPSAIISPSVQMGEGLSIMAGTVVNSSVKLGNNVIINTGSIVEHDCIIADHVHVATSAKLAGNVRVGESTHIGIGATVLQGIEIGSNAIVGAGAVVVEDVPDQVIVVGVPARFLRRVGES